MCNSQGIVDTLLLSYADFKGQLKENLLRECDEYNVHISRKALYRLSFDEMLTHDEILRYSNFLDSEDGHTVKTYLEILRQKHINDIPLEKVTNTLFRLYEKNPDLIADIQSPFEILTYYEDEDDITIIKELLLKMISSEDEALRKNCYRVIFLNQEKFEVLDLFHDRLTINFAAHSNERNIIWGIYGKYKDRSLFVKQGQAALKSYDVLDYLRYVKETPALPLIHKYIDTHRVGIMRGDGPDHVVHYLHKYTKNEIESFALLTTEQKELLMKHVME